jgi:SOS-response transcriptional repressor LexA
MRGKELEQLKQGRVTGLSRTVLDSISRYQRTHHYSPTVRELKSISGLATQTIMDRLYALETCGYITRTPGAARSIVIVKRNA